MKVRGQFGTRPGCSTGSWCQASGGTHRVRATRSGCGDMAPEVFRSSRTVTSGEFVDQTLHNRWASTDVQ